MVLMLCASCLVLGACAGTEPKPLCFYRNPKVDEGGREPMGPREWTRLVLREAEPGEHARRACTSAPIAEPALAKGCASRARNARPSPVRLADDSVIVRRTSTGARLVWLITHQLAENMALGPLAWVEPTEEGYAVRSMGMLEARRERVRFELWRVGGQTLIVAEGETCINPRDPTTCDRGARILMREGEALRPLAVYAPDGECLGPAWVEYSRKTRVKRPNGWERHFDLTASIDHDARYVVVSEQVVVTDQDPGQPDIPPRDVRTVDTNRYWHVREDRLVSKQRELWGRALMRGATLHSGENGSSNEEGGS